MVIDSSAILSIFFGEPGSHDLEAKILSASEPLMSAASVVETGLVFSRIVADETLVRDVNAYLHGLGVTVIPFTHTHADEALRAFVRYGKGRHRAALNFGDCIVYATAKIARMPLLYTGDDFSHTDLKRA